MGQLIFRNLTPQDVPAMHKAFLTSFSDYQLSFEVNQKEFIQKFIEKLDINFQCSVAAYDNDLMVGFIFTNIGEYEGKLTAYNGGTGVLPLYRGQGLVARLYQTVFPWLKSKNVEQCLLEVLTSNKAAINAYYKVGFKKSRYFKCFSISEKPNYKQLKINHMEIIHMNTDNISTPDWLLFDCFSDFNTSYLDNINLLRKNLHNEQVITSRIHEKIVGYAIYQRNGRISRLGVDKKYRRQGIGSTLIEFIYKNTTQNVLTVVNIADHAKPLIHFFKKSGFINKVNQYELKLPLR